MSAQLSWKGKGKLFFVSLVLFLFVFTTALNLVAYDRGFYRKEFLKFGTYLVYEDADARLDNLFSYLKYKEPLSPNYFSSRDILHMQDVRKLLSSSVFVAILSLFLLLRNIPILKKSFAPMVAAGILLVGLALFSLLSFDFFFLMFHKISFSNSYWLMNPFEDTLINLFPERFFYDAFIRVLVYSFVLLGLDALYVAYKKESSA